MIFDWQKIRNSEWLESVGLMRLWSAYADTGDVVPVDIGFTWDTDPYPDETHDNFWREAWIYGEFGGRDTGDVLTVAEIEIEPIDDDYIWRVNLTVNGKERKFNIDNVYRNTIDEIFWGAVKEALEEIAKDKSTFIETVKEELFWSGKPKLFETKEEAKTYGNSIKMTYGFLKEIESELPDGEDAYDVLMKIYS